MEIGEIIMSYQLKDETKKIISKRIGLSYEELKNMSDEEIDAYIEKKTGKKMTWPKGAKMNGLPIRTLEDKEKELYDFDR